MADTKIPNKKSKTEAKSDKKSKKAVNTESIKGQTKSDRAARVEDLRGDNHRVPIQLLVDYKADGHYLFDFCRDLGTGGVFIQTKTPLDQGSKLQLTFTSPDSKETLSTEGQVIWVQPFIAERKEVVPGMGVQFLKFSDRHRKILEEYLERNAPKQMQAS